MKRLAICFLALCVVSCSGPKSEGSYADQKVEVDLVAAEAPAASGTDVAAVPQLAYDYTYTFVANTGGVDTLLKGDQALCAKAGALQCQMISQTSDSHRDASYVRKTLELRVTPAWLKAWQGQLDATVAKANGRITQQSVTSEDLSLQIVDTSARIRNKEALRDRLQQIIRTSNGKVAELVEAETQLAQVQADIDAAKSALAVMQKRVATTHLTLTYESDGVAASQGTFAPVREALRDALGNMMGMIGLLITLAAYLVPLLLVAVPLFWLARKWWHKRRAAKQ